MKKEKGSTCLPCKLSSQLGTKDTLLSTRIRNLVRVNNVVPFFLPDKVFTQTAAY